MFPCEPASPLNAFLTYSHAFSASVSEIFRSSFSCLSYESFLKLSIFGKVKFIRQSSSLELEGEEQIVRDRKEVGVYVILSPQESGVLVFSWQSPLPEKIRESGEYRFIVRKQAGTEDYPLTIKASNFQESLTQEASFRYNAFLARDFVSRIYW